MRQVIGVAAVLCILSVQLSAQTEKVFNLQKKASYIPGSSGMDVHPQHFQYVAPSPDGEAAADFRQKIKNSLPAKKDIQSLDKKKLMHVWQGTNFRGRQGNSLSGIPNDNDVAISNDGSIISVTNSEIYFFSDDGTYLDNISLQAFGDTLGIEPSKYDPKVLYDPEEDRFVICYLAGRTDSTSAIIFAFSSSADPLDEWNFYEIPGNPLNDVSWSDFPMISLNSEELFFTINLLYNDSSWQRGFKQTVIWQMDKFDGYSGADSLKAILHSGIEFEGRNLRNLNPVQGGSSPSTDEKAYFLSNRNFSVATDSFFMVTIDGRISDATRDLSVKYLKSDNDYGMPPEAEQSGIGSLQTNDARVLGSYIEDNTIHFVGNTRSMLSNKATIYHGIISNPDNASSLELYELNDPLYEFGYPNIAYTGQSGSDQAIIVMNHSADTINPGVSAMYYENGEYSPVTLVKEGETFAIPFGVNRWGDYTGIQRIYNNPDFVWISGFYGRRRTPSNPLDFQRNVNDTWLSLLSNPGATSIREPFDLESKIYPNPASETVTLEFVLEESDYFRSIIYDLNGKEIKVLHSQRLNAGKHLYQINTDELPGGVYFLRIQNNKGEGASKKIIIER